MEKKQAVTFFFFDSLYSVLILKEMGTSCEGVKRVALNRLSWSKSVRSCVGLWRLSAAVSYY